MDGCSLVDSARSGAENMAIDQQMLEMAAEQNRVMLRCYQWSRPTLSLGYFQRFQDRDTHEPSAAIDVVRRSTGGGAIVHHHDWTYSLAVPSEMLVSHSGKASNLGAAQTLYDCTHAAVESWLQTLGLEAHRWGGVCSGKGQCSFLCFERRSTGDIVVSHPAEGGGDPLGHKVLGSAQRRHGAAILQHGSLLLRSSPHAPSLLGLEELGAKLTEIDEFHVRISEAVAALTGRQLPKLSSIESFLGGRDFTSGNFYDNAWTTKR